MCPGHDLLGLSAPYTLKISERSLRPRPSYRAASNSCVATVCLPGRSSRNVFPQSRDPLLIQPHVAVFVLPPDPAEDHG